ncbi:response regulator [Cohnella abietis]|uniref:Circadian input-output histidine kinase CikA n=1 Tax=Cohnella abietis TaxID=2507935 RepID=A0A3T1D6R2_9BACL|nr:response regulator [Cohnella abietis]BBI33754.1 hypothetical protein KCTCHS21_31530 [Cohnella abietis]
MFRSLRFKIVIVLVLINTISFISMNLINYETSNKQMNQQLENHSMSNLKSTIANLNTMLSLKMKEVELISRSMPTTMTTTEQQLQFLKRQVPLTNLTARNIGIASPLGSMSMSDGTELQVGHIPAYQNALKGIPAYSNPMLDSAGEPTIWLMIPYYNSSNRIESVIGLALDSTLLFNAQLELRSTEYKDSDVVLIDSDTNLLYHKNISLILKRNYIREEPGLLQFSEQLKSSDEGYGEAMVFGRMLKMFYVKIPGKDWYAVFSVAKKEFEAPLRHSLWINMGLIASTEVILGLFLYLLTQKSILNRLKQVVQVTKNVAAGNFYTPPLDIQSKDEMGILASSINGMINNLQELFEPFQAFIHHNQYAMIVTDSRFVITSYNKRAEEMLGYTENEVLGRKSLLLWHDQNQLQERAQYYSDKLGRIVTPDEAVLFVLSHKGFLPDWEWTWINRENTRLLVTVNPSIIRHPDGRTKGYVLIARDISDIKQATETNIRLLEILESAHDMIASFDMRGHIFYLNQAGHSLLGIESLDEYNNQLSQYMPIPTTVKFADGLTEAQKHGFWQSETEIIGVNGQVQIASITVVAHHTDEGRDTFFSSIIRDISEQKETQRQLVQAKDAADEANEAKSSFLARMSHEIRTPLNGIIGLTYLLQRSELSEIQEDYLRQVSESSQNLLRILNDILDFSKLEADKLFLEQVPFCLEESLQRLSGIFSVLLGPKPVDFIIHADSRIPNLIGDPTRLEQVLLNLCSNAIKFTNFGLIELRISLIEQFNKQALLEFEVKDTGIGLTEQQRKQLFAPFVQADEKTSRKYGGTGLGLVISHTLIERMGGHISVESTYQVGSTFRFRLTLPLAPEKTTQQTIIDEPSYHFTIAVLEDQTQVAEHWYKLLSTFGYKVFTFSNWDQVKNLLDKERLDLVIIDMEAGDMHGEETWISWKSQLDRFGVKAISSTTLLGRDALQYLDDEHKPAGVLVKPASSLQVQQIISVIANQMTNQQTPSSISNRISTTQAIDKEPTALSSRILVVDDQIINRLVAKQLLEQQGFEVVIMDSGQEALRLLEQTTVDLILMDLHMPMMDGIETSIQIRKTFSPERLPIIALTADVTEEQHIKCIAAGMNDIITKPIQPDVLFAVLAGWLPDKLAPSFTPAVVYALNWPETPGLNVSLALHRLDGKSKLYMQLLDSFCQQYSNAEIILDRLLVESDKSNAIRFVHSLSGAAGHLGATEVQENAALAERILLENGDVPEIIAKLYKSLNQVIVTIQTSIKNSILTDLSKKGLD